MSYDTLDYSKGCVNFRDVGEYVNLLAGTKLLPTSRLFRGGKLEFVEKIEDIGSPQTIINLRKGADLKCFDADYFQVAVSNAMEKYDTQNKDVRRWLNDVIKLLENKDLKYPILFHCTSGKDRTGIVVAGILLILQIPTKYIVEEYLLSDGGVNQKWILQAINGFSDPVKYFHKVDLGKVRKNILSI